MKINGFRQVTTRLKLEDGLPLLSDNPVRAPEDAISLLAHSLKDMDREYVCLINLDNKLKPINFHVLTIGGINSCPIPMETVFQTSILSEASGLMLLHNHPSGARTISRQDLTVTDRLSKASQIVGIPLLDHIIVAGKSGDYVSIREEHPELFEPIDMESPELADPGAPNRMESILKQLQDGVKDVFESEKYKEFLTTMGKFHQYSAGNCLLIAMQKPDASLVAGYRAWQTKFGRQVKKGSKAISIIAPMPVKEKKAESLTNEDGVPVTAEREVIIPRFRVAPVFDISDTYGRELPSIAPDELTGKVVQYDDMLAILTEVSPVQIKFDDIQGGAKGYYSNEYKEIVIKNGMEQLATLKTAIHEISHAMLHDRDQLKGTDTVKDRQTMEVEAESIAFVVCSHFGLPTDDYSFPYIASWSSGQEMNVLQGSLDTIRKTADSVIFQIEDCLERLPRFELYQPSDKGKLKDHLFEPWEAVQELGISSADYERVYVAPLGGQTLDEIYTRFNIDHPSDFEGHSLSVGDVIVIHEADKTDYAFYVDTFGFAEVPDFKGQKEKTYGYEKDTEPVKERQPVR